MTPARPRNRLRTADSLRQAAARLAVREGVAAASVRAVAKLAGYDKALVQRYFGGQEGLWEALAEELVRQVEIRPAADPEEAMEHLRELWRRVPLWETALRAGDHFNPLTSAARDLLERWSRAGAASLLDAQTRRAHAWREVMEGTRTDNLSPAYPWAPARATGSHLTGTLPTSLL